MKIRNKLYISAGISIILVVILFSLILITSARIDKENKEHELAHYMHLAISELNIVTYEYLLHHEKRMEQQWNLKYNSVGEILEKEEMEEELEEVELIESIRAEYIALGNLFSQVCINYEKEQKLIQEGASQEKIDSIILLEERLVAQLLIKSQSIIVDASRLAEMRHVKVIRAQKLANTFTLILMIILLIIITTTSLLVARSIAEPIHKLHKATELFEEGRLSHRVKIKTKDEVEQLGNAFNKMATGLGEKRKELQKELTNRKKVEEELKKRVEEQEKFHRLTVGRELKMIELKKRIRELEKQIKD
jgi:HAMP domain-containing protein